MPRGETKFAVGLRAKLFPDWTMAQDTGTESDWIAVFGAVAVADRIVPAVRKV